MGWKTLFIALLAVEAFADEMLKNDIVQGSEPIIREFCSRNDALDHTDDVKAAVATFVDCAIANKQPKDFEYLGISFVDPLPLSNISEISKKYCAAVLPTKDCFLTTLGGIKPCLDPWMRKYFDDFVNIISPLLDYICYNDGERITLYYTDGGPTCVKSKSQQIYDCRQEQLSKPTEEMNSPDISWATKCQLYDETTPCVVKYLEQCDPPTPGKIADSLFKHIRKTLPCPKKD